MTTADPQELPTSLVQEVLKDYPALADKRQYWRARCGLEHQKILFHLHENPPLPKVMVALIGEYARGETRVDACIRAAHAVAALGEPRSFTSMPDKRTTPKERMVSCLKLLGIVDRDDSLNEVACMSLLVHALPVLFVNIGRDEFRRREITFHVFDADQADFWYVACNRIRPSLPILYDSAHSSSRLEYRAAGVRAIWYPAASLQDSGAPMLLGDDKEDVMVYVSGPHPSIESGDCVIVSDRAYEAPQWYSIPAEAEELATQTVEELVAQTAAGKREHAVIRPRKQKTSTPYKIKLGEFAR